LDPVSVDALAAAVDGDDGVADRRLSLRHALGAGFDVELAYGLVVNRSTIDNTNAAKPPDYDDKNYVKQTIELDLVWSY
jgi:hypothetical protein